MASKSTVNKNARVLIIDIEWKPALAYVWQMWKVNINPDMLIEHGNMLCFCAVWEGSDDYMFYSEWNDGREGMARAALELLEQADAVVTYNGDKYDIPKIRGEILLAGLTPPPPLTSIYLIKTIKTFGFNMNRLAYIGPLLKLGGKVKHEGFALWKASMDGDTSAQKRMTKYCVQDVKLTAKLYQKIKPFIKNHPHLGIGDKARCPACNSIKTQKRGWRSTRCFQVQRNQCSNCNHWFETTRQSIKVKTQ